MERVLYNGFLDGVSLDGDRFFYQNPLMSYGNYDRFDWINTPCCPPNVVRLMASLGDYIYATAANDIYVNLFIGNTARVNAAGGDVTLRQETRYPWDGQVHIAVDPASPRTFALDVRIPGWAGDDVMPGGPYQFTDHAHDPVVVKVNGQVVRAVLSKGYARIDRAWKAGDVDRPHLADAGSPRHRRPARARRRRPRRDRARSARLHR